MNPSRPRLDHGALIPLVAMYPAGDVPVVQVSMPSLNPQDLLQLGEKLKELRKEGILVIGSGYMTHSFAVFRHPELTGHLDALDEWATTLAPPRPCLLGADWATTTVRSRWHRLVRESH